MLTPLPPFSQGDPSDPASALALPPELRAAMDRFAARYHHLKTPRRLRWRPHLGAVDLDVSAGGQLCRA